MKKWRVGLIVCWLMMGWLLGRQPVLAANIPTGVDKLGVHIMRVDEIPSAAKFFTDLGLNQKDGSIWRYVTLPLVLEDLNDLPLWQEKFRQAKKLKLIPIVRLATRFDSGAWQIPTRKNVVDQLEFLNKLPWPTEQKLVVIYNEVNHASEWGGLLDPGGYADILSFASWWGHSYRQKFLILPAGLDLAAPNTARSRQALVYWQQVHQADPEVLAMLDAWNSHSYPNPDFSSSPLKLGINSLSGFRQELAWLDRVVPTKLPVYITETGWKYSVATSRYLTNYYQYALDKVWSDPRLVAVTPFILKGQPGSFANFSFLSAIDTPTPLFVSLKLAITNLFAEDKKLN